MSASTPTLPGTRRLGTVALVLLLAAVATIPVIALWKAFGPHAMTAAPDFTLIDQDGRPFTLSSLRGHEVALFFGWTHCPDECPTAMAALARAVRDKDAPAGVRVVFVSVDPARDTPDALGRYLRGFNPLFVGLTGTKAQLDPVYADYHTFRRIVAAEPGVSGYSVEHGTAITYIGRDGTIKGYGHWDDSVPALVAELKSYQ